MIFYICVYFYWLINCVKFYILKGRYIKDNVIVNNGCICYFMVVVFNWYL